jgi:hypothetical protein
MRRNKTMTQTRTQDRQAVPAGQAIGQAVGQAESVLTRLLAGVLAETGTARQTYLALMRLSANGDRMPREGYVRDLSDWMDLDLWAAGELAGDMLAAGLVTLAGDAIWLSAAGAELLARIRGSVAAVMAPVWAALDPADVDTTVRILREITLQARGTLAAQAGGATASVPGGRSTAGSFPGAGAARHGISTNGGRS